MATERYLQIVRSQEASGFWQAAHNPRRGEAVPMSQRSTNGKASRLILEYANHMNIY
jgi:hypothetical protein